MKARIVVATILMLVPCLALPGRAQTRGVSIDQLVAPIALYPDALIAQILLSAADPAQVEEFDRWLAANNKALSGSMLQDAAVKAGFEASFVAHSATAASNSWAATTLFTIPIRSASWASMRSPSNSSSLVFLRGTLR